MCITRCSWIHLYPRCVLKVNEPNIAAALQVWLGKIGEQIDRKADTDTMHATVTQASARAQECLENAAEALESAVNCSSSALRQELKGSTAELVNAQAALSKRVITLESELAKAPSALQVFHPKVP